MITIYCVQNESDHVVARAEGKPAEIYAMHRTGAGALRSLADLRALHPADDLGIRVIYMTMEQASDPEFPIPD